jgi:hypothetical protein
MKPLSIEELQSTNPEYVYHTPLWSDLAVLYEGGVALEKNRGKFLPKRPGEPDDLYKLRLEKLTYNNILAKGINTLVNKLSSSELNVTNSEEEFWIEFRQNVDLTDTDEYTFLEKLFKELLLFGKVYVQVDRTESEYQPRNAREESLLGLRSYLTTYNALEVVDWGYENKRLNFIKVNQKFPYRKNPFSPLICKHLITYITQDKVIRYSYFTDYEYQNFVSSLGEVLEAYRTDYLVQPEVIEHGHKDIPVREVKLDNSEWVSGLVLHKLKEAFRIENQITDAISIGCQLQRTFKPYREPYSQDGSFQEVTNEEVKLGNAYVARVDDYKIVEMEGSAVTTSMNRLREIEQSLFNQLTFNTDKYQNLEFNEASGVSKELDHANQHAALKKYGALLRTTYQSILRFVAKNEGKASVPVVHGFSDFKLDSVNDMLLLAQSLKTCADLLPVTTLKEFSKRFSKVILDTSNPELLEQAEREIEEMDFLIKQAEAANEKVSRANFNYANGSNQSDGL